MPPRPLFLRPPPLLAANVRTALLLAGLAAAFFAAVIADRLS